MTAAPALLRIDRSGSLAHAERPRAEALGRSTRSRASDVAETVFGSDRGRFAPAHRRDPAQIAQVEAISRRIAAEIQLFGEHPPVPRFRRGVGAALSVGFRDGSFELDLDRTLEALAGRSRVTLEDVFVRERRTRERAVILLIDGSGSMRDERPKTAAALAGALAGVLGREQLGVIAFWSDAALVQRLGIRRDSRALIRDLLAIEARGLTNIEFPLAVACSELRQFPDYEARVLLLSDCVHNAGPDPRAAAAQLPRLDVLLDVSRTEHDGELGQELARLGRGLLLPIRGHQDLATAIARVFESGARG